MAASLFTKMTTRGFYIAGQGKWMDSLDSGNGEWDFSDLSHFYFLSVLRTSGITCHSVSSIQHPNHYIIIYISSLKNKNQWLIHQTNVRNRTFQYQ